ncbi:DEAD/DEAH box helicase [Actinomyces naeslundii]|uniref:DEAD/DEAH box helicase n=2 Tax=Actinomyces naeslundii TaxID=1655 RepID=A0A854DAR3_ACTNA|nr:DEAD/DEAH box helicase [Actinomyces naeslundii]OMG38581.1 DEAD/DEAH box helicase [Actinomyces naeslundii]QQC20174.1 DEAD/DEAH box helicase [Actinomyces naeslundii]BDH76823.1 helicase [Actinomyces naeslundii]
MSSPAERYAASRRRQAAAGSELARFSQGYDFPLDPFQEEACAAVERGEGVLVAAPTGAGKTVVGEFAVHLGLVRGLKTFYTTPIKALSNQKYLDLVARHGEEKVGLLTGDTSVNPHADVVVMTTEVLRNMLYSGSRDLDRLGFVVMDEVHYLADRFRGPVWEEVIIHLPAEVQVISLSATVSNAEEFGDWLGQVRGRTAVIVSEERPVPLTQHMMVGRRLLHLYSRPADAAESSEAADTAESEQAAQSEQTGQPPLNPELLKAVKQARRAAASGGASKNSYRSRGGTGRGPQPWKRTVKGGRAPRRGEGGARTARLKPPSRLQVVRALEEARLLPAIVFVFSRAGCEQAVHQVVSAGVDLTTEAEAARIREVIERRTADIPAGDLGVLGFHFWAHALERGVAAHHAGLLPVFKETVEELFSAGLVKVVYATETLALGINMPARTVVLESLRKWNGSAHVTLSPGEYTQLTGRAGRRGIDVEGHAVVLAADDVEPATVSSLASRRTYPLVSAFRPTYNMAVNLLERMPRARVREVLEESFAQFQADRGVVELAAQARRKRRSLEGLEKEMACRLGDFREYAALRQAIADAEADLSRDKAAARRSETGRAMSALGRGDVVVFRKGRRRRHGIVLEVGADRTGTPTLTVLGEDSRVVALTPDTAPDGVMRVGALRVAESVDPHRPRDRDRLVQRLVDALRAGDLEKDTKRTRTRSSRAQARRDSAIENLERLRHEMRSHPCHGCPDREEHARVGRKWSRAKAQAERLQRRIENRTGTIARLFDAVCEVLLELGYLEPVDRGHPERELRVTGAGKVLARIYAERDLLIAECLRTGVFEGLSAGELAGALSACVYEPRLSAQSIGLPVSPGSRLGQCLRAQLGVSHRIHDLESLARIEVSSGAEPALAGAVQAWCDGAQLADILDATELTAGDFVRWCKQLLDVVGQIASLSPPQDATPEQARTVTDLSMRAAEASLDLNRGVVSWSAV